MNGEGSTLLALRQLQQGLATSTSFAAASQQVTSFLEEQLGARAAIVNLQESGHEGEGRHEQQEPALSIAVAGSHAHSLHLWRDTPLVPEEIALAELALSLFPSLHTLTSAPLVAHVGDRVTPVYFLNSVDELNEDALLLSIMGEAVDVLAVDRCNILVWDKKQRLQPVIGSEQSGGESEPQSNRRQLFGLRFSSQEQLEQHPLVRRVVEEGAMVILSRSDYVPDSEAALLEATGSGTLLLLPLVQRQKVLGLLALGHNDSSRSFSERDIQLARNLANQAAVAVEHAILYSQAQRRVAELSAFHQIVLQLNMPLELDVVLESITESALRMIDADNLHIYLWDADRERFTFCSALWRDGRREPAVAMPRADGLTATVIQRGELVVIDNAVGHPLYADPTAEKWGVQAIAGFPLRHGGRVIGAFTVTYLEPHEFTHDELLLMNLLADQAAVAVENARLFTDAQRRLASMSALVDMAKQVTGNLKVELVMETTVQTLQKLLNARASTIALLSESGDELIVEAAAGIKPQYHRVRIRLGEGVSGRAVKDRRMIYIRDTYQESDFLFFDDVLRSLLVAPLISRNEVIGTLTVDSDQAEAFSDSDIQLMTIAAAQVSVAIANARLFEALEERAAELAVAYDELKENDRLKDELVQNVSHELRTPLTFIRGYVDLLMDGEMGEVLPQQQKALQIVSDKTDEVTRLVEDIISLQRIDEANLIRQEFSMAELMHSAVDCHRMSADRQGLALVFNPPRHAGMIEADRGRINQILDNLINNAMKFSPDGGKIELRMIERRQDLLIVVSDQGIGLEKDKAARIFERFYQVDGSSRRRFGGAGIGLAIVKRIVDAHHGDIWVKSELNKGSTFYITLPKKQPDAPSAFPTLSAHV